MAIVLEGLPIPPSINKQLMAVRGRLIKTNVARDFDRLGVEWKLRNHLKSKEAEEEAQKILGSGFDLRVDCYFVFHEDKLYWKRKGTLRKRDTNNLLKSSLDLVSRIINVDDTHFICGDAEKVLCKSSKDEQLIVRITPTKMRIVDELKKTLANLSI